MKFYVCIFLVCLVCFLVYLATLVLSLSVCMPHAMLVGLYIKFWPKYFCWMYCTYFFIHMSSHFLFMLYNMYVYWYWRVVVCLNINDAIDIWLNAYNTTFLYIHFRIFLLLLLICLNIICWINGTLLLSCALCLFL